jgi:hypothetical protein
MLTSQLPQRLSDKIIRRDDGCWEWLNSGALSVINAAKVSCPRGHRYDADNTYVNPKGERNCRRCMQERRRSMTPEQVERVRVMSARRTRNRRARQREERAARGLFREGQVWLHLALFIILAAAWFSIPAAGAVVIR